MSHRRSLMAYDPSHFEKEARRGRTVEPVEAFRFALRTNLWGGATPSGPGSTGEQTSRLVSALPPLLDRLGVRTLLDAPCGDFSWMSSVDLGDIDYVGGDLLPEIVEEDRRRFGRPGRAFVELDLMTSPLPTADLLLCRDCLVHFSFEDASRALANIARSSATWLLTTTFPDEPENLDIVTGDWRPIDLTAPPFFLPDPVQMLNEGCTEQDGAFADKSLGLWRVQDLSP